jgi:hypothetical protein
MPKIGYGARLRGFTTWRYAILLGKGGKNEEFGFYFCLVDFGCGVRVG